MSGEVSVVAAVTEVEIAKAGEMREILIDGTIGMAGEREILEIR